MEFHPQKVVDIVKACVALHNFLNKTDATNASTSRYIPSNFTDTTTACHDTQEGEWRKIVAHDTNLLDMRRLSNARSSRAAIAVRNDLKSYFMSVHGMLTWQANVVNRGCLRSRP